MSAKFLAPTVAILACVACVALGCGTSEPSSTDCGQDGTVCPTSSRTATEVTCDCKCETGSRLTGLSNYEGRVSTCLPPRLNRKIASNVELAALDGMPDADFDREVFRYCSETVSTFMDDVIQGQGADKRMLCISRPVRCSCTTAGAKRETLDCSKPCPDVGCTRDNCYPLLRKGGGVDASACVCSRADTCGGSSPPANEPPICWSISTRTGEHDRPRNRRRRPATKTVRADVGPKKPHART